MKRDGIRWWVCFILLPAVMGVIVAGWQNAHALPNCVQCDCKEIDFWWVDGIDWPKGLGNKKIVDDVLVGVPQGISFIWSSGGCQSGPSSNTTEYVNNYLIASCSLICDTSKGGSVGPLEVDCAGVANKTGTMLRRKCAP